MEINTTRLMLCSIVGVVANITTKLLGGWDNAIQTLLILMVVDYFMGLSIAAFWKRSNKSKTGALSSTEAMKGICKKCAMFLCIIVANRIDITFQADAFRTTIIYGFITTETISFLENLGIMGVKYPKKMNEMLDVLIKKGE